MAICEKVQGPEHPDTAATLIKLAKLLQPRASSRLRGRSSSGDLVIREKALGSEHPLTCGTLGMLGTMLERQGDLACARTLLERELEARNELQDPSTNRLRANLSRLLLRILLQLKRSPSAKLPSLPTTRFLDRDHAWTKDSARVTADALDALGRTEEAKALREQYGLTEPEKPKAS